MKNRIARGGGGGISMSALDKTSQHNTLQDSQIAICSDTVTPPVHGNVKTASAHLSCYLSDVIMHVQMYVFILAAVKLDALSPKDSLVHRELCLPHPHVVTHDN